MDGHKDLVIGLNERYRCVNMPFDSLGQIRPPDVSGNWPKFPKAAVLLNMYFFGLKKLNGRS